MTTKRNWDILTDEKKQEIINDIIHFFKTEMNEDIGVIAAENMLDHFLQNIGINIYNKGVEDSLNLIKEKMESLELDIDSIKKEP